MFANQNINSINDLSRFLKVYKSVLLDLLYNTNYKKYDEFTISKKSGDSRVIHSPINKLKNVQIKIAKILSDYHNDKYKKVLINNKNVSHAFITGKGIITNASQHVNKNFILNIDLEDYFGSFHFGRVKGFFEKHSDFIFGEEAARCIANLLCFNGKLPQGSPASPIMTNLISQPLDQKLIGIARKYKLKYTRYADDITFSTNRSSFGRELNTFMQEVESLIIKSGFKINHKKTRFNTNHTKQKVTGLITNKKINVDNLYFKQLRAQLNKFYREGIFIEHPFVSEESKPLEGKLSFIDQIDKYNNQIGTSYKNPLHNNPIHKFNKREREYRKFLFFKYFWGHSKPVIITEGKTDVTYLKASIKNLYKQYPSLVTRDINGFYDFHVSFFNLSNKVRYFYSINEGADSFKKIMDFFKFDSKKNNLNYFDFFQKNCYIKEPMPVILLIDNETSLGKNTPINQLLSFLNINKPTMKKKLNTDLFLKPFEDKHIYLLTHPLISDSKTSEIEDLFDKETLEVDIKGKTFNRDENTFDKNIHVSKYYFSNYIIDNYKKIDFTNFKPLLDALVKLIETHKTIE